MSVERRVVCGRADAQSFRGWERLAGEQARVGRADRGQEFRTRAAQRVGALVDIVVADPVVILDEWLDADRGLGGEAVAAGEGEKSLTRRRGDAETQGEEFIVRPPLRW